MSTDFETSRALRDVQSRIASLDDSLFSLTATTRAARPGSRLVAQVASQAARLAGNERRADILEKAATAPAQTTVTGWAAELSIAVVPSFIMSIQRRSAWAGILTRCPQVSLLGHGVANVPVAGAAPPAMVVGEGSAIPVRKGAFSPLTLATFKLAAISTFTQELAMSSNIEGALSAILSQSISDGLDAVAFGASGTGSIVSGATTIAPSTATPIENAMRKDFQALLAALTGPSPDVTFVMSPPRALLASSWLMPGAFPYAIAASTAVNATSVIAVDPQGVAAALAAEPKIVLSESAAIHEDDAPGALSATGSPNVVSAPMRGLFQSDTIGMRTILHTGWIARSGAVSVVTSVTW
jgi:hypothetical protein